MRLPVSNYRGSTLPPRRIHLIGSTGSGKSYIAAILSRRLGTPTYDLDDLFWQRDAAAYGVRAEPAERDARLNAIVQQDAWIIEGVYHSWLGPSFDRADLIVALTPYVLLRDVRVLRRFMLRKLGLVRSKRESMRDLWHLLRWNHRYDGDNYVRAMEFIKERGKQAVACAGIDEVLAAVSAPP
jgi:adenylate kinase family enzyme